MSKTRRLCCYFAKFITFSQLEKLSFSFYQRSSIASYSSAGTARAPMSVPLSVHPSVTLRYCIKTLRCLLYRRARTCSFLLQCIALGGYPPPSVQLYVGRRDVTDQLEFRHGVTLTGAVLGMHRIDFWSERCDSEFK